jgi:hypothetical protein
MQPSSSAVAHAAASQHQQQQAEQALREQLVQVGGRMGGIDTGKMSAAAARACSPSTAVQGRVCPEVLPPSLMLCNRVENEFVVPMVLLHILPPQVVSELESARRHASELLAEKEALVAERTPLIMYLQVGRGGVVLFQTSVVSVIVTPCQKSLPGAGL